MPEPGVVARKHAAMREVSNALLGQTTAGESASAEECGRRGDGEQDGTMLFRTGWFVESLMTQTLIIRAIRTDKIPFLRSLASWALTLTTPVSMALGMWLPCSLMASALDFTHLPALYRPILMLTLFGYIGLTQMIKVGLLRKHWI